ncbi:hypothetical protein SPRG_02041 [Saprolegnia parasitica CBS 223.65]|uniref:Uncharacterized protein n=1 Tax=Saprolegnia parasitica (strain CBS 223.65) TaxID=695850 RepID=A0A067D3E3_SAPPC|nr:hypothetical protein SPRG_02041 [Saprolegnia parasitica CBS 223.65]KDO33231.1 hypothetical protein SPRG_02041 [Saprolegnia parasitica CBS 223.65]|eukprot:XP_012195988.1 hypothetical protein SPRG_02041 [Saprolegnia parasitica CBS 223.65]
MSFVKSLVRQFSGASSSIETVEQMLEKERQQRRDELEQAKQTRAANAMYQSAGLSLQDTLLRSAQQQLTRLPSHGSERSFASTRRSRESSFEIIDMSREGSFHEINAADMPHDEFVDVGAPSARRLRELSCMQAEDINVDATVACLVQHLVTDARLSSLAARYSSEWIEAALQRVSEPVPAMYIRYRKVEPVVVKAVESAAVHEYIVQGLRSAVTARIEGVAMDANDVAAPQSEKEAMAQHDVDVAPERNEMEAMAKHDVNVAAANDEQDGMAQHDVDAPQLLMEAPHGSFQDLDVLSVTLTALERARSMAMRLHDVNVPSPVPIVTFAIEVAPAALTMPEQDAAVKTRDSARAAEELAAFYANRKQARQARSLQNRSDETRKMMAMEDKASWGKVLQLIDSPTHDSTYASVPAPMSRMFNMLKGYAA